MSGSHHDRKEGQLDLESKVTEFVRTYIAAARCNDVQEPEALRWMCTGLEYLLGEQLEGRDGWKGWVDGIIPATDMLPDAIQVISAVEVSVRGYAIWAKASRDPFWIDPFFGIVRISKTDDKILAYELHFGDAARGLGTTPYGKHLRWESWFLPAEWMFRFSKSPETPGRLQ
jgi:hypothetical protein